MAEPADPPIETAESPLAIDFQEQVPDDERELRYEDRVLAWIDILGWSELLRESIHDPAKIPPLFLAASALRYPKDAKEAQMELANEFNEKNLGNQGLKMTVDYVPEISHFSDTVVWSFPMKNFWISGLVDEVQSTCCLLLANGYLSRGAIVRGPLFHERGTLFGPAVLEAHELESSVAVYPRVLIGESMGDLMPRTYMFEDERHDCLDCRTDFDGLRYLDILGGGPMRTIHDQRRMRSGWDEPALLAMAETKLAEHTDLKKRAKWGWMVKYLQEINNETDMSIPIPQSLSRSLGRRVAEKVLERHDRRPTRSP